LPQFRVPVAFLSVSSILSHNPVRQVKETEQKIGAHLTFLDILAESLRPLLRNLLQRKGIIRSNK
jgi:hypothetical protein